ncbi:MAG: M50 family metallopeptidase [Sandaracinaceae bacterium]|nr:M50 family metallopeptidase [Sandaracinaceae bacterium]
MPWTTLNVAIAVLGISLLVIVHESGHYLAARAFGMRVLRYSIGLGPPLWRYKPKNSPTTFQVCAIPLLAYVQIDGMNPTEQIDPNDPGLYPNKSVFARIVTIFAGPFANYLAASVMIFVLGLVGGYPDFERLQENQIGQVHAGTPAAAAGLRENDVIVEANGKPIHGQKQLVGVNTSRGLEPTEYVIERGGERLTVTLTPVRDPESGRSILGVTMGGRRTYTTVSVGQAAEKAIVAPWLMTAATFEAIASMIERRTTQGVSSVVKMGQMLTEAAETAAQEYVALLIQLSVALGLFNLLPIPALDGGRLTFLAYEVITRRRANEKVEAAIHTVGLLFLLGILALVMARDVMQAVS